MTQPPFSDSDSPVARLHELFQDHSAWRDAARCLEDGASSDVYFSAYPESVWHLERRDGEIHLSNGPSPDPDLVLRFTPNAVASLISVEGDIGDFAVRLFHLIVEIGADGGVELRVVAPFSRLVRRGYLSLLASGGLRVLAFGAANGVRTLRDLRGLVERLQAAGVAAWEAGGKRESAATESVDRGGLRWRLRRVARDLAAQHDRLRELVGEINRALESSNAQRAAAAFVRYSDALAAHFALEERVVFPALHGADPRNADTIETLLRDHASLFAVTQHLIETSPDAGTADWKADFYELRRSLSLHESREEGLVNSQAQGSA